MSRLPPLPPGVPPRGSYVPPPGTHEGDSYRARDDYHRQNDNRMPYAQRPPPPIYQFRGNNEHDSRDSRTSYGRRSPPRNYPPSGPTGSNSYRPREEFTFRGPTTMDFGRNDSYDSYRPRSPPRSLYQSREAPGNSFVPINEPRSRTSEHVTREQKTRQYNDDSRLNRRGGFRQTRGRGGQKRASDRAFLNTNRAPTPELMQGVDDDKGKSVRYRPIGEMSDSEEAEMSVSESENETGAPKKKQARTENKAADGDSVPQFAEAPKWSNPDPYTALPPPDDSLRKKKDVVKLIRKARVVNDAEKASKPGADTDDFISFDFGDIEPMKIDDRLVDDPGTTGASGAPTGPRQREKQVLPAPPAPLVTRRAQNPLPNKPPPSKPAKFIDLTPDPALGSRKRTIRDELKSPPEIYSRSRGKKGLSEGKIVPQWQIKAGTPSTPWLQIDQSGSVNMGIRMHKEIVDFYHYVKPRKFEETIRIKLVEDLRIKVRNHYHDLSVRSFGSFPAGLYLPTSDMDLVCVSDTFLRTGRKEFGSKSQLFKFESFLREENIPILGTTEIISSAKVPLVKYVDRITGLRVDVSFENDTGLIANKTFQDWKVEFPAMPVLVTIVKHLLAMRGLNEPQNGGIGGFSVICLVVSLLQHMPQVQSRTMIAEHHLGEVLMEFFDLYGNEFNTRTTAISLKPPAYIAKAHVRNITYKGAADKISIIDPNRLSNDISGGASNSSRILRCFSNAFRDLQDQMSGIQGLQDRGKESILGCILAGDYSSFELQREHLAHVHEKLVGPIED